MRPNARHYAIRLQYRLGASGPWRDARDGDGVPIEYARHETAGHSQRTTHSPASAAKDSQSGLNYHSVRDYYVARLATCPTRIVKLTS